jgi:hypothetical protein
VEIGAQGQFGLAERYAGSSAKRESALCFGMDTNQESISRKHRGGKKMEKTKHTPGPLPSGWSLKDGFLRDSEGCERFVKMPDGKIDRLKISVILDNNSYPNHARLWHLSPVEAAAPDLLEACRAIAALMDGQGRRNLPLVSGMARAAIAKAEGMEGD